MELEAYKETLDPEERNSLKERPLEKIRSTEGIKEEFISDILIEFQENEILKSEAKEDSRS